MNQPVTNPDLKARGFTLIELMIVVAIIGILAAIAIPKFSEMLERSKEGATKSNLGAIRSAISIYYGKNEGSWPGAILATGFMGTTDSHYIAAIPKAAATPLGNTAGVIYDTSVPSSTGTGWRYSSADGSVWANSTATDTKGESFTSY